MGVPPSPDDEDALLDAHPQMTRPTGCPLGPRLPLQGGYVAVGLTRGPTLCILRGPQPSRSTRGMAREHRGWLDPLRFRTPPGSRHRVPHGAGGSTIASGTCHLPPGADAAAAGRRGISLAAVGVPTPFCALVTGTRWRRVACPPVTSRPSIPGASHDTGILETVRPCLRRRTLELCRYYDR